MAEPMELDISFEALKQLRDDYTLARKTQPMDADTIFTMMCKVNEEGFSEDYWVNGETKTELLDTLAAYALRDDELERLLTMLKQKSAKLREGNGGVLAINASIEYIEDVIKNMKSGYRRPGVSNPFNKIALGNENQERRTR